MPDGATRHFALRYGRARPLLAIAGTGPDRSGVEVSDDVVRVRMGWAFEACFALSSVTEAGGWDGRPASVGVHGRGGTWSVIGCREGLVQLVFDPPQRARVAGVEVRLEQLRLSLEQPAAFLEVVTGG